MRPLFNNVFDGHLEGTRFVTTNKIFGDYGGKVLDTPSV